jgi:hypothetical protein
MNTRNHHICRIAALCGFLLSPGLAAESIARYARLGLSEHALEQIPENHILAFRVAMTNAVPFFRRGYLKDWYALQLAQDAPPSAEVTVDEADRCTRLSVSGAGRTARASYTLGYAPNFAYRGVFRLYGGERIILERSALSRQDGKLTVWVALQNGRTIPFADLAASASGIPCAERGASPPATLCRRSERLSGEAQPSAHPPGSDQANPTVIEILNVPMELNGQPNLRRLWVELESATDAPAEVRFYTLLITRPNRNTRLDADTILADKPVHKVEIRPLNSVPTVFRDGIALNSCGHSRLISHENRENRISAFYSEECMQGGTYRITTALGEDPWNALSPPTWNGPDHFDFSYPDREAMRVYGIDPTAKFIFCLAIDGARWWNYLHPDDAGMAFELGVADYLSDRWRADQEDALEQFYAFLSTRPYYKNILGFMLWSGGSMDCNMELNIETPQAIRRFKGFLQDRYSNVNALRKAWNEPDCTFETAMPRPDVKRPPLGGGACPLLVNPATHGAYLDTVRFKEMVFQTIITDFCAMVKRVSGGDLLAGARTGDFMGHMWNLGNGSLGPHDTNPIDRLLECTAMDFFEVQEPYLGRYLGYAGGSGAPVLPFTSVHRRNKLIFIQNDTPLHTGDKTRDDFAFLTRHTRRVYVNGMVNGLYPYQLGVGWVSMFYPELIEVYGEMNARMTKAMRVDRSSVAEVAFVFDLDYQKYIGFDPQYDGPARSIPLFDHIRYTWARAGVPYDMILLQDLPTARDYKVYVFVHCFDLSPEEQAIIARDAMTAGKTAVFLWADGVVSSTGLESRTLSELTGIDIRTDAGERNWLLNPTPALAERYPPSDVYPMSTMHYEMGGIALPMDLAFCPSFTVEDPAATPLAVYADTGETAVARKEKDGCTVYYSGPAILPPNLLRSIVTAAGCHTYLDTEDACYVNASLVGLHAGRSGTVRITLPEPSPLTDVFTGREYPSAREHALDVEKDETYLFFRGSEQHWE